jgi:O-antigen ligase
MKLGVKAQRVPVYTGVLTTIAVMPSFMDAFNIPKLWIVTIGSGISFGLLVPRIRQILSERKTVFLIAIPFTIGLFSAAIFSSQGFYRTLLGAWARNNGFLAYTSLLILFIAMANIHTVAALRYLANTFIGLGFLLSLYGVLQIQGADFLSWENPAQQVVLTLGNSDFSSAFLALTSIATFSSFLTNGIQIWKRIILALFIICEFYVIANSRALQGVITLIAGCSIVVGLHLIYSKETIRKRLGYIWWAAMGFTGILAIVAVFGYGPINPLIEGKIFSLTDRYYHWLAGLRMMQDNLLNGVGLDNYGTWYRRYRDLNAIDLRGTASTVTNNAHNTFVQFGATGGLLLLIGYLVLLAFIAWRGLKALKSNIDQQLVGTLIAVWISFLIQSFVSIDQLGLAVWGWLFGGAIVGISYSTHESDNKKSKNQSIQENPQPSYRAIAPWVLMGLIPAVSLMPILANEYQVRKQIVALISTNSPATLRLESNLLLNLALNSKQPELRSQVVGILLYMKSYNEALQLGKISTEQFPESFELNDSVAKIYEASSKPNLAIPFRKKTISLDPLNSELVKLLTED